MEKGKGDVLLDKDIHKDIVDKNIKSKSENIKVKLNKKNNKTRSRETYKINVNSKYENTIKNPKDSLAYYKEVFAVLPLIILLFFLPFIIRLKLIPLEGVYYDYWTGEKTNADFFTYYKQIFIYLITIWSLLHTFFFVKKIKRTKAYYFMGAYALIVILSAIFSDFPVIALHGFVERKEGMWIILCYISLMFSGINLINTKVQIKAVIYTLGASGAIISLIGIFQYIGIDIFTFNSIKEFVVTKEILDIAEEFSIAFGEKYAYSVFYNPNYLGGYISFYAPLMLGFAIYQKNIMEKIIFMVFFILSILALFASRSEAGVLGFTVALTVLVLTFIIRKHLDGKDIKTQKNKIFISVLSLAVALIGLPLLLSFAPIEQNPLERIRKEAIETFTGGNKNLDYKEAGPVNDIRRIDDTSIEIIIQNIPIKINTADTEIKISAYDDSIYQASSSELNEGEYVLLTGLSQYHEAYVLINKTSKPDIFGINLYLPGYGMNLYFFSQPGILNITDSSYRKLDIEKDFAVAEHMGFEGKGNLGSGRGYIWSRSLPIVFDNLIIGTGQDTFITQFPQYDIYGKQAETNLYSLWILTDKPHSIYLQIAIQSGLLSLLILIVGFILLSFKSFRIYITDKNLDSKNSEIDAKYAFIINSALIGFMVSSIFNDSILAITPIVYVLLGLNVVCILDQKSEKVVK